MYPRNAASPERISIGAVVQISDGAVQTSGVTVKVIPFGGSEASGGGTTAYSADGIVLYTPTQAETNYTSFVVAAVKSGCIPASVTIVTTASATAGKSVIASIDNSAITAASIASDAITDAKVASDVTIASVTGAVGSVTGNVGGNVTGSVGSVVSFGSLVSDIATAVWGAGTRTLTAISDSSGITTLLTRIVGTLASGTHNAQSGDSFARLGAPAGASIAEDIAGISVGSGGLDADGVRAAIGLASANLDTQLGDLPTNAELATALAGADDATLAAIAAEAVKTAAIKAKTDNLPSDPADASDIAASFSSLASTLSTISGLIDTEIAAIKTKTDGLPADTAAALTTIQGYVDTLETEVGKIIKSGESRTYARSGETSITFTETRA